MTLATSIKAGKDVYAIGAPASKELAFSLARGIASGTREFRGAQLIQVDTPVSPGNSGGPLVDERAQVVGVVSRKLVGGAVEGISFGVPTEIALKALGLEGGSTTEAKLRDAPALKVSASEGGTFVDAADPVPSLTLAPFNSNSRRNRRWLLDSDFDTKNRRYFRGTILPWIGIVSDRGRKSQVCSRAVQLDVEFEPKDAAAQ